jgi:ketosteroid isomerase-like protein
VDHLHRGLTSAAGVLDRPGQCPLRTVRPVEAHHDAIHVRGILGGVQTGGVTRQDTLELADRLFAAIEAGDTATVAELYAPDVKVWHNYDQIEQERDANLAVLGWMSRKVSGILRVYCSDGAITRIEEYLDTAQVSSLMRTS